MEVTVGTRMLKQPPGDSNGNKTWDLQAKMNSLHTPPSCLFGWVNFFHVAVPSDCQQDQGGRDWASDLGCWLGSASNCTASPEERICKYTSHPSKPKLHFPLLWLLTVLHENLRSTFRSNRLPRWQRWQCFPSSQVQLPPFNLERIIRRGYCLVAASFLCRLNWAGALPAGPRSLGVTHRGLFFAVLQSLLGGLVVLWSQLSEALYFTPYQYGGSQSSEVCKSGLGASTETLVFSSPGQSLFYHISQANRQPLESSL